MHRTLKQTTIILLAIGLYMVNTAEDGNNLDGQKLIEMSGKPLISEAPRTKRASSKPGFFRTLFAVASEQYQDTKDTFGKVNNMINDNFLPENQPKVETTTSSDPNVSTTAAPYKITRTEFNRIIRRNIKGIMRLFNIELQQALKQSKINRAEYNKNISREVSKFL
ncbi:uncharacterized protein LOC143194480 [Rhynchophorus ferrugineus]|uniref:uncharacterized protein LOC143194480 n=1 Tax=Rhynchophorus ferrugineus TaxID=354439 RepID=UPI003FCDEBA8